jgi:hypothetical protein
LSGAKRGVKLCGFDEAGRSLPEGFELLLLRLERGPRSDGNVSIAMDGDRAALGSRRHEGVATEVYTPAAVCGFQPPFITARRNLGARAAPVRCEARLALFWTRVVRARHQMHGGTLEIDHTIVTVTHLLIGCG